MPCGWMIRPVTLHKWIDCNALGQRGHIKCTTEVMSSWKTSSDAACVQQLYCVWY